MLFRTWKRHLEYAGEGKVEQRRLKWSYDYPFSQLQSLF